VNISRLKASQSASSSKTRILCFVSIPVALIANAARAEIQARTAIIFGSNWRSQLPGQLFIPQYGQPRSQ
jgi:hypothetical protein